MIEPLTAFGVACAHGLRYIGLHASEAECWCTYLGWPDDSEIDAAKNRGLRCVRLDVSDQPSGVTMEREAVQRLVAGFEHVSGIARLWEPDHSTGEQRAKWARATEACADVVKLLAASQEPAK